MANVTLLTNYNKFKKQVKHGFYSSEITKILNDIYLECLEFLDKVKREKLVSKVDNKEYFAFTDGKKITRAVNSGLYQPDFDDWRNFQNAMTSNELLSMMKAQITKILYTMAISFCACIDLIKDGDQKTPGTFFEYFIAYFFTWRVGVEPQNSIQILNIDRENTRLSTDFIFNMGSKKAKFHMPIKTSTRERSIMLWAHQKLLDGVYGIERFMGTPVLLAETKTDKKKREVVEICLPEQWRIYQLYIAKLKRIYYLDLPSAYDKLNKEFPPLVVKPFSEFFFEWSELASS